jgi:23S rRNA pseudouridine2604 synthase
MTETIRLAKRVAEALPCSRSEAEQYIENGWVEVNGTVIEEPGFRVAPDQQIALLPGATPGAPEPVTLLLHKPAGIETGSAASPDISGLLQLLTPAERAADDRSGIRLLRRHFTGLRMTDALEAEASGLVVLTADWRIARKLIDDAARIEQEYIVEVGGTLTPDGLALLNHGLRFSGKALAPVKVSWQNETRLRFALKAPARGLIRHMCEAVGLEVRAIRRIRIGRLPLAGLPQGQWRYMLKYEKF